MICGAPVYRAIYEDPVLSRYAVDELPSIQIIVKNGGVALEGQVEGSRQEPCHRSGRIPWPNVSGVKNNLVVRPKENSKK